MEKELSIIEATASMSSVAARINEMCGGTALLASAAKPQLTALDAVLRQSSVCEIIAAQSKWSFETVSPVTTAISALTKNITEP